VLRWPAQQQPSSNNSNSIRQTAVLPLSATTCYNLASALPEPYLSRLAQADAISSSFAKRNIAPWRGGASLAPAPGFSP
jgi:hypothetical protein